MLILWIGAVAGCGGEDEPRAAPTPPSEKPAQRPSPPPSVDPAHCPPALANCQSASGRILYVERTDPDGDGDAHFVLLSRESITAPGITVVDVGADLRPRPLPGPGDQLSAAGPVYTGSHRQRQIQAEIVRVARER